MAENDILLVFFVTFFAFCCYIFMMNNLKKAIVCGALLAVLFVTSCGDYNEGDHKTFDYDLRGTWVLHEEDPDYDGYFEISNDLITIWGFEKDQTPWWGFDEDRPFGPFTKDVALKGYSEDGKFFIEDRGRLQEGIPYTFWKAGRYPEIYFLTFTFGENEVTFRKE
jgi:hypothetical protein